MLDCLEQFGKLIYENQYQEALELLTIQDINYFSPSVIESLETFMHQIPLEQIKAYPIASFLAFEMELRNNRIASAKQWYSHLMILRDGKKEGTKEHSMLVQYVCVAGLLLPDIDNAQVLLRLAILYNEVKDKPKLLKKPMLALLCGRPSILRGNKDFSEWGKNYKAVSSIIEPMISGACEIPGGQLISAATAELLYQYNDLNGASLQVASALSSQTPEIIFVALTQLIRINHASGAELKRLSALFSEVNTLISDSDIPELVPIQQALQVRFAVVTGDLEAVNQWLEACTLSEVGLLPRDSYQAITKAQALIATGKYRDALVLLEQIHVLLREEYRPLDTIECFSLSAVACELLEDREMALNFLVQAIRLAEPYAYIRVIADRGAIMLRLLSQLMKESDRVEDISDRYFKKLLEATKNYSILCPGLYAPVLSKKDENVELTATELQIVYLMAQGKTNKQIGDALHIKVTTVKFHSRNVFEKLNASNRTAAVSAAKKYQLI